MSNNLTNSDVCELSHLTYLEFNCKNWIFFDFVVVQQLATLKIRQGREYSTLSLISLLESAVKLRELEINGSAFASSIFHFDVNKMLSCKLQRKSFRTHDQPMQLRKFSSSFWCHKNLCELSGFAIMHRVTLLKPVKTIFVKLKSLVELGVYVYSFSMNTEYFPPLINLKDIEICEDISGDTFQQILKICPLAGWNRA